MFKRFLPLIAVVCLGCQPKDKPAGQTQSSAPITIGTETWPGYLPIYVARDKGYFKDEGLDVRVKRYVALGQLSKDYVAGLLDGRANLTLDAINEQLQGLDHKVVLAIDYSNGSDAIVARPGISTVKDFSGKRVAYEPGTLEEFFLAWALAQYDLSLGNVVSVPGNPEQSVSLLNEGRVDAAVTHEPFLSKLIKDGKVRAVYSSAETPGLITDILTFKADFIETNPKAVEGVLRAYFKALDFWKNNPGEAHSILAREFGDTPENIARQMRGITMLGLKDNRIAFSFASGLQSLYGNMRRIGEFVHAHEDKNNHGIFTTDNLIESRFIRELSRPEARAAP